MNAYIANLNNLKKKTIILNTLLKTIKSRLKHNF